ncbi:MAG TPA: thioredoxin-disulfide reductase [Candidatus Merdimorpha stercoravium]|uniref:Thioredoxin reductase n=1 Tax=Candidatus Merdimorpha stercoravium TaxID=2840863 RepID=A0A9D1KTV6_9FLAO|nr:thioredoxin-disulfide reductase [Candidatus Merdimorpha stercoravium]
MENPVERVKILIIGSGPAGYTAAIYAARADLAPVLYTGLEMGGQLTKTTEVENFPGFPEGVDANLLMSQMEQQARRFGTDIRMGTVTRVALAREKGQAHRVEIDGEKTLEAQALIVATGASARWLGLPSEERLKGFGVSACATCDGFFYRGKTVAVVGGGDSALEEADYLSKICAKVYLIVRRDAFRASKAMQARVSSNPKIDILWNSRIDEILGQQAVEGVRIKSNIDDSVREIALEGVFVAIGHHPSTELFAGQLDLSPEGYILTQAGTSLTNLPGVFAAGDVQDNRYRQAITSAGSGCKAALDAEKYLAEL